MATSYRPGHNLFVYLNDVPVGCAVSSTITITTGTQDITTQCDVTNGVLFQNNLPTKISWQVTTNGFVPILASSGQPTEYSIRFLQTAQLALTKVYIEVLDTTTGQNLAGDAWITSTKLTGESGNGQYQTYDVTFDGSGPLSAIAFS